MKITQLRQLIREEIQSVVKENKIKNQSCLNEEKSIIDFKKWKSILIPFYKEVINDIKEPNMSLNIYSRWVGDFIKNANTYTSYDSLIDLEFKGQDIKTNKDLKNQLVKFINFYK